MEYETIEAKKVLFFSFPPGFFMFSRAKSLWYTHPQSITTLGILETFSLATKRSRKQFPEHSVSAWWSTGAEQLRFWVSGFWQMKTPKELAGIHFRGSILRYRLLSRFQTSLRVRNHSGVPRKLFSGPESQIPHNVRICWFCHAVWGTRKSACKCPHLRPLS